MNTNPFALRPNRRRRLPEGGPAHWFSFVGAGALIAVGYIDPGNWATALGAGAGYGYQLLGMVVLSSLMAMLLQWLSSRLGVVTGRDLAQVCRERSGPRRTIFLWLTSEVAIIACDVAEVVGSAVALQLLLGVSLTVGVLMSAVCTFALLALQQIGGRKLEAVIALLIGFVGLCFVIELALARPDWHAALAGTAPSPELLRNAGMLWLAAGIVGATVMPHNLYLHSSLVKHHAPDSSDAQIKAALHVVNIDTIGSLLFAFVINAALLIVAAAVFHASGHRDVTDLADAHRLIAPLLGTRWAGILFAAALLACGLSATVTGTLAGQAVMEGFLQLRLPRWKRALLTRALAIGPALVAVTMFGQEGSNQLLVASQVVLSLQLPLAVVPLIRYASDASLMRDWRVHGVPLVLAWMSAGFIILLNGALLWQVALGE
ncbi:manganese transport protein [Paraburkholderia sp. GV068]|jgi:manganese transport protein|uniref:Nramp family divalent metal transporter n=1 Tax=Paraburkholderia TaxID=1822464 RepID=UPI000D327F04|nr:MULTISPECIES: Nramp family divalent metal transporter [Paraburkholderia]AXF08160.1 divalent metal cation transporter [Paraburkholderia graminis]MDR6466967.1 manganese transport protein [Paraburkholderia graminis]MDR6473757.1 manganese transport protein [Paraburkholderia graminis]PTR04407.1 manganese transport protein [Paraburkholderia sp. GV072]PUB09364.1 manganese transport protein [Paraburkholderia sp. GV068]